ncbi:MAG TPA: response regulator, partial [Roseiflexaceae bacterium]|nr:response regulator [Roseiflexaceae bacterium]
MDIDVQIGQSYRILLVEDNPGDADLVVERFADLPGYQFDMLHVTRLQQATEALRRETVDAVILDLNLPDSRGLDTLRRLRADHPDVAFVVFSGLYS